MALHIRPFLGALLVLAAASCAESPTGPSGGPLVLGRVVRIQGQAGSVKTFTVEVPTGTGSLLIQAFAGSGDADMYVTFGAPPPETGPYDCFSESYSEDEECHIDNPAAGTWYISIVGYTSYSGVDLVASLGTGTGAIALQNDITVTDIAGALNSARLYSIVVPGGATQLRVELSGPNGDADLYVRRGAPPTLVSYNCVSTNANSNELCTISSLAAGRYYILVDGYAAYTGLSLTATVSAPAGGRE